jgi:hypothetical protein
MMVTPPFRHLPPEGAMLITAPLFRPVPDGSPEPVDIVVVHPADYPHSGAFAEVAETLQHGLRALGYDANI